MLGLGEFAPRLDMASSTPLIPVRSRGRELTIAAVLIIWLVCALGFLIQSDPPTGRLVLTLTAQDTGQVILGIKFGYIDKTGCFLEPEKLW